MDQNFILIRSLFSTLQHNNEPSAISNLCTKHMEQISIFNVTRKEEASTTPLWFASMMFNVNVNKSSFVKCFIALKMCCIERTYVAYSHTFKQNQKLKHKHKHKHTVINTLLINDPDLL